MHSRSSAGASEHEQEKDGKREDDEEKEEAAEQIWDNAKMLAFTAHLLPAFAPHRGPRNCLDVAEPHQFSALLDDNLLSEDVRKELGKAADTLFWCTPICATEHGHSRPGRRMKTPEEIVSAWTELFGYRRMHQPDDTQPMNDQNLCEQVHNTWMNSWLRDNLTPAQEVKSRSGKTSIFNVHVHNVYGSKRFVMAMLQTGLSWAPGADAPERSDCALYAKNVAQRYVQFFCYLLKSLC